jgi:threonine dehydrogenase-like Zn-dependent dehydrogenase
MKAVEWFASTDVRVVDRPRPMITDHQDAIIRITSTTVCGSDLHLYHNEVPGMERGDVMGHEFMGFVEAIGPEVKNLKIGDRVVVGFPIACGKCWYCKNGHFTCCDCTNPSKEMEKLYGHRISGMFGYSHLTGGYDGGQAEYARVPYADVNCLHVPSEVPDEKLLFLSDVVCTGWHATECGKVSPGQTVVVWGCGPVGLMALMWAKFKGANRIIGIDAVPFRLEMAREKLGAEVINFAERDVLQALKEMVPGGPDVCIDAVGFRFPKSLLHKMQRALKLETDAPSVLEEMIMACRKAGYIGIVGDYFAYTNQYPIGAFMEKGLNMSGGQAPVQRYWKQLLGYIESGKVDPSFIITHRMPLEEAREAYKIFDTKEDNAIKILLKPATSLITK